MEPWDWYVYTLCEVSWTTNFDVAVCGKSDSQRQLMLEVITLQTNYIGELTLKDVASVLQADS